MKPEQFCSHRVFRICRRKTDGRVERRPLKPVKCRLRKQRIPVWAFFL
jgi:hypothetical protein